MIEVLPVSDPSISPPSSLPRCFRTLLAVILRRWLHAKYSLPTSSISLKQSWTHASSPPPRPPPVFICPYQGVQISAFTSGLSSTLHQFFNTIIWMLQEFILLYSLFQRMLCHLLIAKRTIEHIWKRRAILNYFLAFFAIFIFLY